MDTVTERHWTTEGFLAWEDRQEGRSEFDGHQPVPMTGSVAHQDLVFNLRSVLAVLLAGRPFRVVQEMRLRIGSAVRYPDIVVGADPIDQAARTLTDAVAIFEVLSDDTARIDRVDKLIEYAALASLRCYGLLEQTAMAVTLFHRAPGADWTAMAQTDGVLRLPGLDVGLPLADVYRGPRF
jgi:Uma2 family endonuclease